MAQPPAVVIIARHGMRLDAADPSWHLSTPTPYDPPLTYGGWNQSRALGLRIASLLHAREQELESSHTHQNHGHHSHLSGHGHHSHSPHASGTSTPKRRKRKHRVVIHSSPFLRCLETSVGIAAGMAQYEPPRDVASPANNRPAARYRTAAQLYSASSKFRSMDSSVMTPLLASIVEPKHDSNHSLGRKGLQEQRVPRRAKLRVDPFLGEWLNPQYFENITPPPPSSMMLATAKAELMHNEIVDVYTPSLPSKTSQGSLWGGTGQARAGPSRESTLDDWSSVHDALPAPRAARRDRANSVSSVGSNESGSGRKSPFRSGHVLQPLTSIISPPQAPEKTVYTPPTPSYAISSSDRIPRGYVSHARSACVNVDTQWDSSRSPLGFGDGGESGEEWSSMHKRFRKGVNNLIEWYSQHNADDRGEDALGLDQAEHQGEEEEQEDLVVILVTHGAGCNALIGAITNQPVLLDVGMASLTMAIRREDAPPLLPRRTSSASVASGSPARPPSSSPDHLQMSSGSRIRSSLDIGLNDVYDVKVTASTDHLRHGPDPTKANPQSTATRRHDSASRRHRHRQNSRGTSGTEHYDSRWLDHSERSELVRSNTSTALGSIRRPSIQSGLPSRQNSFHSNLPSRQNSVSSVGGGRSEYVSEVMPVFAPSVGLWQPPSARNSPSPAKSPEEPHRQEFPIFAPTADEEPRRRSIQHNTMLDFSNSPPDSRSPSPRINALHTAAEKMQHHHHYTSPERHGSSSEDDESAAENRLQSNHNLRVEPADEKATQRDSVLGTSESHDDVQGLTRTTSTLSEYETILASSSLSRSVSIDRLGDLSAFPPPPRLARSDNQVNHNHGLWCAGNRERSMAIQAGAHAGAAALTEHIPRRFDLQPKRRWTAINRHEELPLPPSATAASVLGSGGISEHDTATLPSASSRAKSTSQLRQFFGPSSPPTPPLQPSTSWPKLSSSLPSGSPHLD